MTVPRGARLVYAPVWLGDATMSLPTLRALRRAYPEEPLVVFARKGPAAIYRAEGTATHVVPSSGKFFEDRRRLREMAPREIWLLALSFRAALMAALSGAKQRIGFATDHRGFLLTHPLPAPATAEHQLAGLRRLVESRGLAPDAAPPRLPPSLREGARGALERAGVGAAGNLILLAPGSANPIKRWPVERFGRLAAELRRRGLVCGIAIGPGERGLAQALSEAAGTGLPVLGEDLDPAELAGVLAHARVVVCNDSGAMHLAAAVGAPLVALFGLTDPRLTSPTGVPHRLLDGHPLREDAETRRRLELDRIPVSDVVRAVEELLAETPPPQGV
ncbi:MAG: glycosyltransferase family 9 protein [Thermoanaerobaculia bacterium]|nr:glycosyltransferase family 9 protein [Thermoanaerobaculia bacterium]